jgi:hypothetical protein
MGRLFLFLSLLLGGCGGMTDEEVRSKKAECAALGGEPVVMSHLDGRVSQVRCM